ncbi:MAG TPA: ABC transporter ATP-binding protein [Solirubrobacteraceae bacterium]
MSANGGAAVIVQWVAKSYGRIVALHGVSLIASEGEFLAITGPSGSGKSTLLNLIGTLDTPDSGTISVGGKPVPPPREAVEFRRRLVGFVFQDHLLLPYLSAQSNVETALLATGVARHERVRRARDLLDEVGLSGRVGHLPSQLSAGERQRVAIARALANAPQLLLADEPTGALDSAAGDRVLDLLAATRDRHGMTLIIASHDPAVPARADRVVALVDGRLR